MENANLKKIQRLLSDLSSEMEELKEWKLAPMAEGIDLDDDDSDTVVPSFCDWERFWKIFFGYYDEDEYGDKLTELRDALNVNIELLKENKHRPITIGGVYKREE